MSDHEVSPAATAARTHNVFENPELLVRLLINEIDVGYKLVTFYTASSTLYVAVVGVMAQQYFGALAGDPHKAFGIACLGLALSVMALAAPFGLHLSRREIAARAERYAAALSIQAERFTVIRFGTWLSLCAFAAVAIGWIYLLVKAT